MRPYFLGSFLVALSIAPVAALIAQEPAQPDSERMTIHVAVSAHNGDPVDGLTKDDFTLTDNKHPAPITDFHAAGEAPVQIFIVLDAVNLPYSEASSARQQLAQYFSANPKLPQPTALGVLLSDGLKMQPGFTTDGNALRAQLDQYAIGLRTITKSAGVRGDQEQMQLTFSMFTALIGQLPKEGRKRVIWVSPGWPVVGPGVNLNPSQLDPLFANIVAMATVLRRNQIVVDVVNPGGAAQDMGEANRYQGFMRAPRSIHDVELGQLNLQVIALQSGGIVLEGSNDIPALIRQAVAQTKGGYELTFTPPPGERPDEYHELQVKVRHPGVHINTSAGYYARPVFPEAPHSGGSHSN